MLSFGMESSNRICCIIHNLKFSFLIIISISSVENSVGIPLFISELSVISEGKVKLVLTSIMFLFMKQNYVTITKRLEKMTPNEWVGSVRTKFSPTLA